MEGFVAISGELRSTQRSITDVAADLSIGVRRVTSEGTGTRPAQIQRTWVLSALT